MENLASALALAVALHSTPVLVEGSPIDIDDVTSQRVMTLIESGEPGEPCDKLLLVYPGFTEGSNIFGGDFSTTSLEALKGGREDLKTCGIGFDVFGREVTGEEADHDTLAKLGFTKYLEDVRDLTESAIAKFPQHFTGELTVFGHSMGALAAMEATEVLLDHNSNVERLVLSAPASDGRLPGLNLRFLAPVLHQVPKAVWQTLKGRGATRLSSQRHQAIMGTGPEEAAMSVPDSPKLFLGWGFKLSQVAQRGFYSRLAENGVEIVLVEHEEDGLIPRGVINRYNNKMEKVEGLTVTRILMPDAPHGIPLKMSDDQKNELSEVFY